MKRERERERDYSVTVSTDCLDDSSVTESDDVDGSACMIEDGIEVFGEEDMGVCGEVGCWVDSGWDSQKVNARELIRGGITAEKKNDEEAECHSHGRIGEERDRPGVPEDYDRQNKMVGETNVIFSNEETAEQTAFGHILEFPTQRRPTTYRRQLMSSATRIPTWFEVSGIRLGESLTTSERQQAELLLYTWKDLFVLRLEDMPVTDLVEHRIPVHPDSQLMRAKNKLYTKEEFDWVEEHLPEMLKAGIIGRSESPWAHQTKFVRKKDGGLRMVHVFCPINGATRLSGYPMKQIEPVVNNLMQSRFTSYFQADAANGYWAVAMYPPHAY